jgi:acylphosphatase
VSATALGVTGYVKNAPDGTVLVCGQGLPDTLREFIEHLHEGSLLARVDAVSVDWGSPRTTFTDFSILHS